MINNNNVNGSRPVGIDDSPDRANSHYYPVVWGTPTRKNTIKKINFKPRTGEM